MDENQPCVKYIAEFTKLSGRSGLNEVALVHFLYTGLPDRLKNPISNEGKPKTVEGMKNAIRKFDRRYWERQDKLREARKARAALKPGSSSHKPGTSGGNSNNSGNSSSSGNNSGSSNSNNKSSSSSKSNSSSGNKGSSQSSKSNSGNKAKSEPSKLGNDGKLTQEERQRRIHNKLCLFCGGPGHMAKDCPSPKSSASQAKARAANTSNSGNSGSAKA